MILKDLHTRPRSTLNLRMFDQQILQQQPILGINPTTWQILSLDWQLSTSAEMPRAVSGSGTKSKHEWSMYVCMYVCIYIYKYGGTTISVIIYAVQNEVPPARCEPTLRNITSKGGVMVNPTINHPQYTQISYSGDIKNHPKRSISGCYWVPPRYSWFYKFPCSDG